MFVGAIPSELLGSGQVGVMPPPPIAPSVVSQPAQFNWESYVEWTQHPAFCTDDIALKSVRSIAEFLYAKTNHNPFTQHLRSGGKVKLHQSLFHWVAMNIHIFASRYGAPIPRDLQLIIAEDDE